MRTQTNQIKKHSFLIEQIDLNLNEANQIESKLREFLVEELDFPEDRISNLECRRRDGFIPFSHNLGGLEAIAFMPMGQADHRIESRFKNTRKTVESYKEYCIEEFLKERPDVDDDNDKDREDYFDFEDRYFEEDTVLLGCDVMLTECKDGIKTLNFRFTISAKDSPYHRKFDDKFEFNLSFKTIKDLERGLKKISQKQIVKDFSSSLWECF